MILIDPSAVIAKQLGLYRDGRGVEMDRRALVTVLTEYIGVSIQGVTR